VKRLVIVAALFALACGGGSPTDPTNAINNLPHGTLSGLVTIGPICPVESATNPCPTPPSAYAARKVQVWNATHDQLLHTVDIDNGGFYSINLGPATYVVDLKPNGADRSSDVPATVAIKDGQTTKLDIRIDTGIR
jgi:hypothetical protein